MALVRPNETQVVRKGDRAEHPTVREVVVGRRERSVRVSPFGSQVLPIADSVALCDPRTTVRIVTPRTCPGHPKKGARREAGLGGLSRFGNEKALLFFLTCLQGHARGREFCLFQLDCCICRL